MSFFFNLIFMPFFEPYYSTLPLSFPLKWGCSALSLSFQRVIRVYLV
ncbi:hypothetical protein HPHPP30_0290 [Helicobacter pylori Hp P-30]|nr:hypothetical protein HPHPP30_0290 [Helicobacter pylori Hp P-30]